MRDWQNYLDKFTPSTDLEHEMAALRVCQLATKAAGLKTYGVGALLLDEHGQVLVEGHNQVYADTFRSDLHAEMVVINRFEAGHREIQDLGGHTLVTSLEPCPMCMTRLIFAGVGTVLHVCPDPQGGMVEHKGSLPPIFRKISADLSQVWGFAECSEALRDAAFQIWDESRVELDRRIVSRGNRAGKT